jgi:hypothetical protein
VWDAIEHNELAQLTHQVIASYFDKDPPAFYEVSFSYHDRDEIKRVFKNAGFQNIKTEVLTKFTGTSRPEDAAAGLIKGNPVAIAITEREPALLPIIADAVASAIKSRFGETAFRVPMRAIVVEARS